MQLTCRMTTTTTTILLCLSWAGPFLAWSGSSVPSRVSAKSAPWSNISALHKRPSVSLSSSCDDEWDRLIQAGDFSKASKFLKKHPELEWNQEKVGKLLVAAQKPPAAPKSTPPINSSVPTAQSTSWLTRTLQKCKGADAAIPPAFSWEQTGWTFSGALLTLLIITNLNRWVVGKFGGNYAIVLGPFGALMTLMFGLTSAPASQPRTAILGQIYSLSIAYAIGQSAFLPAYWKQSLATSLAIGVMVKTGTTHPPAGAAALLFSTGSQSLRQVLMMLVANVAAILTATFLNNLSGSRQYPTTWGLRPLQSLFGGTKSKDE